MSDAPQGWECPKCGTVHAPSVTQCSGCKPERPIRNDTGPNFPPRMDIADDHRVSNWYIGDMRP